MIFIFVTFGFYDLIFSKKRLRLIIIIYLNCKWVFTRWQCTTLRHNTHHTQTNTAHKTTQTIKDTLHTMNHCLYKFKGKVLPVLN
jgi:hypothetical protein